MNDFEQLYAQHEHLLEDFWGRRDTRPRFQQHFYLFGRLVQVLSNDENVLVAAEIARLLYSTAPPTGARGYTLHLIVRDTPQPRHSPGPPPENLSDYIQYTGYGDWLAFHLGPWGHAFVDLTAGTAVAVLTPALAARPDLVSRCLLNTIFNNLLTASGFSMLHATGLLHNGRALLLMAPHNSGKSTTALRLVMAGYTLLTDSQIYLSPDHETLWLMGFPVGLAKLRPDMLADFPQVRPYLTTERVRDETKYRVNLRQMDPTMFCEEAIAPAAVEFCLLSRNGRPDSTIQPATQEEVLAAVMTDSGGFFYDTAAAWQRNLVLISRLVDFAHLHHLQIGTDPAGILAIADELCS